MDHYDAIILGATAEGVSAALTAAGIGMRTALVDYDGFLDGTSAPTGPVVLSLLHETLMEIRAAHRVLEHDHTAREHRSLFGRVYSERRRRAIDVYRTETRNELEECRVSLFFGRPRLTASADIDPSGGHGLRAPLLLLAMGSRPRRPARFPFDGSIVCDVDGVVEQDIVPNHLVVVGADIVGCEFACMFAALGCSVTLVDRRDRLLRFVDPDLREVLHGWMQRSGVTVVLGETVERIDRVGADEDLHAVITLGSGRVEICDRVLIAAGSEPVHAGLRMAEIGIDTDARGHVAVGDGFETSKSRVFAAGGIVDGLSSLTARIQQGRAAILSAADVTSEVVMQSPSVIYTVPEIATIGLSEEACVHLGATHVVGTSDLGRSLRSRLRGESDGLLKLVVAVDSRQLLGVHIVGTAAAEIIGIGATILQREGRVEELAKIGLSPHSLSQAYYRAALDAMTKLGREPADARSISGAANRF